MGALGAVSAALARKVEVEIGATHREPVNLYIGATAPSGERKRVIRDLAEPLYEAERDLAQAMEPEITAAEGRRAVAEDRIKHLQKVAAKEDAASERERLIRELDKARGELPVVPPRPQLVADDTTPEELGRLMACQSER